MQLIGKDGIYLMDLPRKVPSLLLPSGASTEQPAAPFSTAAVVTNAGSSWAIAGVTVLLTADDAATRS